MSNCTTVVSEPCNPVVVVTGTGPPGPAGDDGSPGDVASVTNVSLDGEVVLFSGLLGKTIKRSSTLFSDLALASSLTGKVDKIVGYGLSKNDLTDILLAKLNALVGSTFVGEFGSEVDLIAAFPAPDDGSFAYVTAVGDPPILYIWDALNTTWSAFPQVPNDSAGLQAILLTDPDFNVLTDTLLAKVNDSIDSTTFNTAIAAFSGGTAFAAVVSEATTVRVLSLSDIGKYVRLEDVGGCDLTIENQATVLWPAFPEIRFKVATSGPITLTLGAGVTVNYSALLAGLVDGDDFFLKKIATDVWDCGR